MEAVIPAEPLPLQCWFSPRDEKAFALRPRFRPDPHLLPSSCVAAGRDIKLAAVIKIVSRRPILGPAQSRPGCPAEPISFINGAGRLADGAGGCGSPLHPVSRCATPCLWLQQEEEDRIVSPLDTGTSREKPEKRCCCRAFHSGSFRSAALEPNQCSRRMPTRGGDLIHCSVRT